MTKIYRAIFLVFFTFFFTAKSLAQEVDTDFDEKYTKVFRQMGVIDSEQSQQSVDSLLAISKNAYQKSKSFMLKAIMSIITDEKADALFYALESEKEAVKSGVIHMQVRTSGFLSTLFMDSGLYQEALVHIDNAEKANAKMKDAPQYTETQLKINDERAFYEYYNDNFARAIAILEKSRELISQMSEEEQLINLFYHHEAVGANYVGLKEYKKAREQFQLALSFIETTNNHLLKPKLYNGLAQVEIHDKNFPEALAYLEKAEDILATANQEDGMQMIIYRSFADYYKALDMHKEALHYDELYSKTFNEKTQTTQKIFNKFIEKSQKARKTSQKRIIYLIVFSVFVSLLAIALLFRLRWVRKQKQVKYEKLIQKINSDSPLNKQVKKDSYTNIEESSKRESIMAKETEERILEELKTLEENLFFINRDVSLTNLAAQLDTNTKYVSYIINVHRGKDYSNYINELRIRYIIKKLQTDPEYLNYKIAYLADEVGFSSHSKFATVFKSFTGLSPSVFINHLQQEKSKNKKDEID